MRESVFPVLIVGAGPTGLTAATLLARYGVRSLVVERHSGVYPLPRAVHLDDEVVRILQRVGVAERFAAISRPARGMRLVDAGLRVLAEFRRDRAEGDHGWPQANMFDQPDLEALLRENLTRHSGAVLRGGAEVESMEEVEGGPAPVRVVVRELATGERGVVWAEAVLGCDGANGITRAHVGAGLRDLRFAERWLVVDIRCGTPIEMWDGVHQVCDPRRPATFMQIGPDRYRWEFRLRPGETEAEMSTAEAARRLLAPWLTGVGEVEIVRHSVYAFRAVVADRWRRGRVFLLGDAAHLTPPFIGQGLGAGLRDAANLAWKLARVLDHGASEQILDTYQAERRPHVTHVIRNAVLIGWAMTGGQDKAAAARRAILAAATRIPGITALAMRTISPRLRTGPLVRRGFRARLPGSLCPQPWIDTPDGRRRLDDLLDGTFALITTGPVHPELAALAGHLGAPTITVEAGDTLHTWLRGGRAAVALIRPDGVVLATEPPTRRGLPGARLARHVATLLPPVGART